MLFALATPALVRQAAPQAAAQTANSFAPPADKEQLWHIQIYRVKSATLRQQ